MLLKATQEQLDDMDLVINRNCTEWVAWYDEISKWEICLINEFCKKRWLPIIY